MLLPIKLEAQEEQTLFKAFGDIPERASKHLYDGLATATVAAQRVKLIDTIALAHLRLGNTDSVIFYGGLLKDEVDKYEADIPGSELYLSKAYDFLAKGKLQKGLPDEALKYRLEGIDIASTEKNVSQNHVHKLGLGAIYLFKKEYEQASSLFEECILKSNNESIVAAAYKFLGDIQFSKEQTDSATQYYQKATDLVGSNENNKLHFEVKLRLGQAAKRKENFSLAGDYLIAVKDRSLELGYYDLYIESVLQLGDVYYQLKDYQAAEMTLSTALVNAHNWSRLEMQKRVIKKLIDVNVDQENYKNAYALMTQFDGVTSEIIRNQNREEVKELEIKYQTLQKEKEILSLQEEQLLKEGEIKRQKIIKNAVLIGFLTVLIPVIALLYVYYQKLQAKSQLNIKQEEVNRQKVTSLIKEQELKLVNASVAAQNQERRRIARELHDSIGGNLAGIKLQMAKGKSDADRQERIMQQLDETYHQVREISHNLVPYKFNTDTFTSLIDEYISNLDHASTPEIVFIPHPKEKVNGLPEYMQIEIFRILQELLTNALKHAKAKNIEMHLHIHGGHIQLLFEDDGVGFNNHGNTMGIGLENIEDRLKALKGKMNIDSAPDRGTAITIEVPLSYK
ncbi:MAG: tetratricopeptide repeat-containing sensor histidine kinase [Cyclobacteriaceae bacterium]